MTPSASGGPRPGLSLSTTASPTPSASADSIWPGDDPVTIAQAAERLAAGGLVAFPTETVYGLGARADDDRAVAQVFAAKGRPSDHPLIVHVLDAEAAGAFAATLPPRAVRLMRAFWPGPLTVIVTRRSGMAGAAAGGATTVGLRCPAHPVARALLAAAAQRGVRGVAAPSANRFGRVSPTCAAHVVDEFGPAVPVLDGGPCEVGVESTIVDVSRDAPVLLRPGGVARDAVEQVLGEPLRDRDEAAPRASGTLEQHYAPRARVVLLDALSLSQRLDGLPGTRSGPARGLGVYSRSLAARPDVGVWRTMPQDPAVAAHELFAVLRDFDAEGVDAVWVERVPDGAAWEAVADRLRRAAAA
ncbi:MAG: L-threonylcarbamoyladenylate synthase [Ideonella sp.]|jgi:L-threonylcarbamoyladenylate synthase|nr:L-threonylcarbamoyladenylate synthase [Ideonella sp.]